MRKTILPIVLLLCAFIAKANNVQITNVAINGSTATFNLSWENSWNSTNNVDTLYPNNWDAVWVFVKVQSNATNLWSHQNLAATGHSVTGATALSIETQGDNVGVFIRRTNAGHGNITNAAISLELGALPAGSQFNFKVFGIEMVRVPAGSFYIGDGNAPSINNFDKQLITSSTTTIGASALYAGSTAIPAAYPKGTGALYAMKYEITNEQYADFLNTLTYDQQALFFAVPPNAASKTNVFGPAVLGFYGRAYIQIDTPGINNITPAVVGVNLNNDDNFNDVGDGLNVAQAILGSRRFLAYLDWSGLRPMTEFEFEKICRGSRNNGNAVEPLLNEYGWGTTDYAAYTSVSGGITDKDKPNERFVGAVVNGRCFGNSSNYPSRVGIFAEGATGRAAAGAGFYGNMNMSDNVLEIVVSAQAPGASYTGSLGDGILNVNAEANQPGWPAFGTANAYGGRGTYFGNATTGVSPGAVAARLSNRAFMATPSGITDNIGQYGGRGVR